MHRIHSACLALITLVSFNAFAAAPGEAAAVREIIDRIFDAMREGDAVKLRTAFHPQARLLTITERDGKTMLHEGSIEDFAKAVGEPHDAVWDERIWNVRIDIDGNLAAAWMDYGFWLGETFSHCGVDAMQLLRTEKGWQVFQLVDTRRAKGCDLPAER